MIAVVALAGGLGAVVRFLLDAAIARRSPKAGIPLGTAIINITGSFALGWITGYWAVHGGDEGLRWMVGTGFLGGYTTFSTASVEAARLTSAGEGWRLAIHAIGMLLLSVIGAFAGMWLGTLG